MKAAKSVLAFFVWITSIGYCFGQLEVTTFFGLPKDVAKKKFLSLEGASLIAEYETLQLYGIDSGDRDGEDIVLDLLALSFAENKCVSVGILVEKELINEFIRDFNSRLVATSEYHWIDYEKDTNWEIKRLEGVVVQGATLSNYFSIIASPHN
ncbi:hypothetical protein [Chryseolinea lacunae]|uniref:Uncharacterized protein n=1 Tax=Chryseolinea lacunae TaxID=2801331 RepID=A0ABS1KZ95_9BACT|nr:hypothetical protein [Chryseolinea lacunae]MBL0744593.1 hypothetical protein [Chryseolinea lacunae]